jgi:DNA-binding SARP family transcriptional activator
MSMDATPESGLRIYLLGRFHVAVGAHPIDVSAWRRERAATLIKLLALAPNHRLHREQVVETLWPDSAPGAGNNALHQVIYVARRILESHQSGANNHLQLHNEIVSLPSAGSLWIDAEVFETVATRARRAHDPLAMQSALDLYRGDLLPDNRYEEWTVARRDALQRVYIETLLDLAEIQAENSQYGRAIAALRQALDTDPAHEEAHAGLMRIYALSGQRYSALRQYRVLQEALAQELGTHPQLATQRLYEDVSSGIFPSLNGRADDSRGGLSFPTKPAPAMTNLPLEVNSFIGRSHDVTEVSALLSATRVLTLIGAGGCGKTRLAVHIAAGLRATEPMEIPFVDLSSSNQASLVPQAVAAAIGVAEQSGRPIIDTVIDRLRTERLVLLLDNCEHLVDACARLVQALVQSCPYVRVLCTSREPLHIPGELVWRVSSLSLPDPHQSPPLAGLLECESIRLFCDRASAVDTSFTLTDANSRSIAQICHRLDGIPLALELAAARVGVLSPEQIVARLDDCFTLLSQGSRTAMSRQQTMKALLDWSYMTSLPTTSDCCSGAWQCSPAPFIYPHWRVSQAPMASHLVRYWTCSSVWWTNPWWSHKAEKTPRVIGSWSRFGSTRRCNSTQPAKAGRSLPVTPLGTSNWHAVLTKRCGERITEPPWPNWSENGKIFVLPWNGA